MTTTNLATGNSENTSPALRTEQLEDLTARLVAADLAWSHEVGDPPAEPRYLLWLASRALALTGPDRPDRYLSVDQLGIRDRFYGVPVCWIGEDGDAIAITTDPRRGRAAVHALGRLDLGGPVSCSTSGEPLPLVHVRFAHDPVLDEPGHVGWRVARCQPSDPGAVTVVWLNALCLRPTPDTTTTTQTTR